MRVTIIIAQNALIFFWYLNERPRRNKNIIIAANQAYTHSRKKW
jgi:hypothetical protein